ncbi:MAG TPA: hypothetical protein VLE73_04185 [Candidatus Saccharimonadales bacterium]|nr:hypothetical protein [Candidatus Saccharimonadales bacterium]
MPKYNIDFEGQPTKGTLVYIEEDHAFNFTGFDKRMKTAAITINETLQVEFLVETGKVVYVWGYYPKESWGSGKVVPPHHTNGEVYVDVGEAPDMGVGYEEPSVVGKAVFDRESGWFHIGAPECSTCIEVADHTVLGFDVENHLRSVWLHPDIQAKDAL